MSREMTISRDITHGADGWLEIKGTMVGLAFRYLVSAV